MAQDRDTAGPGDENVNSTQNPQRMASEMAQAFQELSKGEQTASALEKQLDGIERRIEELLAAAEATAAESQARNDGDGAGAEENKS